MQRTFFAAIALVLVAACEGEPKQSASTGTTLDQDVQARWDVQLRWTSYGIPHVKAEDWGSLGYGFAYAVATDAVCVIARDVAMVRGELAQAIDNTPENVISDTFHRAIITDAKVASYTAVQSERASTFADGYVAGYNRYLRDNPVLPESCKAAAWVRPISTADVTRLAVGVGIRYGLGRFQTAIAAAAPGPNANDDPAQTAHIAWDLPEGIGSNAVAVGSALSDSGRGILLGNPHYPWHGSSRFHLIHTTIPGELDVMGTSLLNTTRVAIGFNSDMAWTHTVSTAMRYTLYRLQLNPEDPTQYFYDGAWRSMRKLDLEIPGQAAPATVWFSHFGPMLENEDLPWSDEHAYAIRDAVLDNYLTADTYDAINKARSVSELETALHQQGVYWTNTIAADREGRAFYADISGTPNVDAGLLARCRVPVPDLSPRVVVLDGVRKECEWHEDERSRVPGALPPEAMPRMTRLDYVTNSNDSYWLSNPDAPLEGYSPVIGAERTARSLRTRAGLHFMAELIDRNDKVSVADIQNMLYSHRNYGAELLLDDVLKVCNDDADVKAACAVLSDWDRTMNNDSVGSHVWREFWDKARRIEDLYAVPFDAAAPVATPRGVNLTNERVASELRSALAEATSTLREANIPLDAKLAQIQYAERNGKKIPIPGGEGWAGMFSMIVTKLTPDQGYTPIIHGNSYIQAITWDAQGKLIPHAMLAYSQSPNPQSPHYSDLTELYSAGQWITLPFSDAEIEADPNLVRLHLTE